MSRAAQMEIDALLHAAEQRGMCLVPSGRAMRERLYRRVANGTVQMPYRGIFARTQLWEALDPLAQGMFAMRALCMLHPSWVFCKTSAALAYGLYLSWRNTTPLHVMLPSNSQQQRTTADGIRWELNNCSKSMVTMGVRAVPLERAAVDCLCELPFSDALAIADSWMRITGLSQQEALEILAKLGSGKRGITRARLAIAASDPLSENGGESQARAAMLECGYQRPRLQTWIEDPIDPKHPRRVDYLWQLPNGTRVVGELDGGIKYTDPAFMNGRSAEEVRERERLRESHLAMPGTAVMRFSLADAYNHRRFQRILDSYGIPQTSESLAFARAIRRAEHPRRRNRPKQARKTGSVQNTTSQRI